MLRTQQLPMDASALASQPDTCHCVADTVLENRYNILRAEEHARTDGKCGPQWSTEIARRTENRDRNRYTSVVPWDHSRVLLPVNEGSNDYINASWVELGSRTYIASQGPLKSTVHDFWQMVYAYGGDPATIVMLTALHEHSVEKCAKYWPDSKSQPLTFEQDRGFKFGLTVTLEKSHSKHEQYKLATFVVTPSDPHYPPKLVHHVYYHTWLDLTKPSADADIRALIHLVNNELRNPAAPPIVHCSAGIGRTGTFIAIDALLSRIDTCILPAVIPRFVPIWSGDTRILQFRKEPFTGATDALGSLDEDMQRLSKFDVSQASTIHSAQTKEDDEVEPVDCESPIEPEREATAKSGPVIKKVKAKITSVAPEVFSETPGTVNVIDWFSSDDPVMSTVRTLRKQRPKMVQGKQQLGYIYDQFEVGQQLARVNSEKPAKIRRSSTIDYSGQSERKPSKPRRLFTFNSERRGSEASTGSQSSSEHKSRLKSLFAIR